MLNTTNKDKYKEDVELVEYVDEPAPHDDFDEYKDEKDRFDEEH